jgi:putative hemolysin
LSLGAVFPGIASKPFLYRCLSSLETLLAITALNRVYVDLVDIQTPGQFFARCLQRLHIHYQLVEPGPSAIPATGPLIIVANHPFGGLEGLILGALLAERRPDVKCLGNTLLQHITVLRDWVIPVDLFGHRAATRANGQALKAAIRWVRQGGALVTFPAGEVSHLRWRDTQVADTTWSSHIGALIRHTQATVVPIYFHGRNSALFQGLGLLHRHLRTLLLPRELMHKEASTIKVTVGAPCPWSTLARLRDDVVLMAHLRLLTYGLQTPHTMPQAQPHRRRSARARCNVPLDIAPPVASTRLQREVAALPTDQCLVEQGEFSVHLATAEQIPTVLQEIGRLRECTFRAIGEGTGRAYDLDTFDQHYSHLFLWHRPAGMLVGAYRLGLTDVILRQQGPRGLYTHTLFRFKPQFFMRLEHSIELGRAFIREEYQRHGCLGLLWRGIAALLLRMPQYQYLFGPVSVSATYHALSQQAMVQFLWTHKRDPVFASYVRPRCPYRHQCLAALDPATLRSYLNDFHNVTSLVTALNNGQSIPILLQYYLQLGATLLSFNVDKNFAHAIDGLILVDMLRASPLFLRRFMGRVGYAQFMAYHGHAAPA